MEYQGRGVGAVHAAHGDVHIESGAAHATRSCRGGLADVRRYGRRRVLGIFH
uniref:Uncharacterized protein n=1 Tax=Arundo donax TaxID=35708 RepID=A0A0A9A358_ARUDO